jgi:MoaA/NifB/PqqE/SkfB family radical SAM enzyme
MDSVNRSLIPPYRVYFTWDILYECNYKCSYCNKHNGPIYPYPSLEKLLKLWNNVYEKYGSCHIHIAGGEPLIFPNFLDLIKNMSEVHTLEFSTNLSLEIYPIIEKINPLRVRIQASYHPEFSNFKEFCNKVKTLKNNGFDIWITYVGYPPYLHNLPFYKEEFEKITRFFIFPFGGRFNNQEYPQGYTEEEKKILGIYSQDDHVNKRMIDWRTDINKSNTEGKLCRMGQMYAKIYPDGEARSCCMDKAVSLGNFYNETFKLLDEPVICKNTLCSCWRSMIVGKEDDWLSQYPQLDIFKGGKNGKQ